MKPPCLFVSQLKLRATDLYVVIHKIFYRQADNWTRDNTQANCLFPCNYELKYLAITS